MMVTRTGYQQRTLVCSGQEHVSVPFTIFNLQGVRLGVKCEVCDPGRTEDVFSDEPEEDVRGFLCTSL